MTRNFTTASLSITEASLTKAQLIGRTARADNERKCPFLEGSDHAEAWKQGWQIENEHRKQMNKMYGTDKY